MSECMTIDICSAEEKYSDEEVTKTKVIVQSILNEAVHSVVVTSESDPKLNEVYAADFLPHLDYTTVSSTALNSQKITETSEVKKSEENVKAYKLIKDQALVDSELRIENGKIHLQSNWPGERLLHQETCYIKKEEKDQEGMEILNVGVKRPGEGNEAPEEPGIEKAGTNGRPFTPFTTDELRQSVLQVWKNVNSSVLEGLDGELVNQPQEVVRLMEELSAFQVTPIATDNPNTPRACTFTEEDVKKQLINDIDKINFQLNTSNEDIMPSSKTNDQGIENLKVTEEADSKDLSPDNQGTESSTNDNTSPMEKESEQVECRESDEVPEGHNFDEPRPAMDFISQKFNDSYEFERNGAIFTMPLTESDEAFIESSESVIQIIEPQENSSDEKEEENSVKFSLPNQSIIRNYDMIEKLDTDNYEYENINDGSREKLEEDRADNFQSGMTTVGPMKNLNYDPKSLTGPEVDYGKMIKIGGSQELTRGSASGSLRSSTSKKIYMDDNDDNSIIFFENGYMEFDTIVNHDIASLTKVQKVKEVMSSQPKSDIDLKDEENILRSPLDLKDVDAESFGSYNIIDIGIPLLTVEERNPNNPKEEYGQSVEIILNANNFRNSPISPNASTQGRSSVSETEDFIGDIAGKEEEIEQQHFLDEAENSHSEVENSSKSDRAQISPSFNKSVTQINTGQKHNTISRVLQKASNRFIMKDSDSFLRNSKSLPRDTSKIANTDSFKSLLDDCQTSAAAVLKKSKSLLRNTQNVLKAVSKTGFGHTISGDKEVYHASDGTIEQTSSQNSTSSKKSEFLKFKDSIKSRVGKTLKTFENMADIKETGHDWREVKNRSKNETEGKLDQSENTKKLPPKSPLVCANQFPQGESCENQNIECEGSMTTMDRVLINSDENTIHRTNSQQISPDSDTSEPFDTNEKGVAEYVINTHEVASGTAYVKNSSDIGKNLTMPMDNSLQNEAFDEFITSDAKEIQKSLSNSKLRRKNKKLSARIRSFWQTAFGKVKATSQKKDVS